ncbi:unnamed protein product [Adineta steineri]|uniref:guanylate cyclase n=1 Tax=Adineta steineri TaxID=433720 RepID=A0A818H427_9BILA|nr:unnamed protein product [Adineta steineri]CAF3502056.1 unnamed protein product [Adineta steineri]
MLYGIILESARDGVIVFHGDSLWKRIVHELNLPSETFQLFARYEEKILFDICECMANILHEGTSESYLEFFGEDFVRYFVNFGFDKILRVAGRTLRDFLFAIDQLHDSNRFTFPNMIQPLFHVTEENATGATLVYKSVRHGFARYAKGGLVAAARALFQENITMNILHDWSTPEFAHIAFWVQFNNIGFQPKRILHFPSLPNIKGETFFRVFPFSILMNSSLRIYCVGENLLHIFPDDTPLIGRPLDEVFRLIRPNIHVEWDKVLSYGRHIVFLMENRLPLRSGSSGKIQLKGQMKYLEHKNMLWFLCHPVLGSANDMISAGLHLSELNLFDSTSDILITGIHQEREIEEAIAKQHLWSIKLQESKKKLIEWRKRSERLLYSILPKHIAIMLQSGVRPNSICESHPLVTVLFAYLTDFKVLSVQLDPASTIQYLNQIINTFDEVEDNYDVFKVETKADASYMVVAGLTDRSHLTSIKRESSALSSLTDYTDEQDDGSTSAMKNPHGFHQTEIIAYLALDLLNASKSIINPVTNQPFKVKFGFHSGTAVGGIVGRTNIQYCLFGDTINMASRITTCGEDGRIHLSQSSYNYLVVDNRFTIDYRGQIEIKSKGVHPTYWLIDVVKPKSINVINKNPTQLRCPFTGRSTTDLKLI